MPLAALYTVESNVHSVPSYTGQNGFAVPMDKGVFITVLSVRADARETNCHASLGARLQK